jgi:pimeloyl-ACP methyl ester carboxylesterase
MKRKLYRSLVALLVGLGVYLLMLFGLASLQVRMIFPGSHAPGQIAPRLPLPTDAEWVDLTVDQAPVVALYGKGTATSAGAVRPVVLLFYGNGSSIEGMLEIFALYRSLGADVLMPEYPGYGMSDGLASEKNCYACADAAYDWLTKIRGVPASRIVIVGHSLGGAVAIDLAARRPAHALVSFSAFTRMADMVSLRMPFLPGLNWLLQHRFDNQDKISQVACPITIVHGARDGVVPVGMQAQLAAACRVPPTILTLPECGHNDLLDRPAAREMLVEVFRSVR